MITEMLSKYTKYNETPIFKRLYVMRCYLLPFVKMTKVVFLVD